MLVQADPEHPSFHVVALGLPGYGFSEAPKKTGFSLNQFAEVYTFLSPVVGLEWQLTPISVGWQ